MLPSVAVIFSKAWQGRLLKGERCRLGCVVCAGKSEQAGLGLRSRGRQSYIYGSVGDSGGQQQRHDLLRLSRAHLLTRPTYAAASSGVGDEALGLEGRGKLAGGVRGVRWRGHHRPPVMVEVGGSGWCPVQLGLVLGVCGGLQWSPDLEKVEEGG